MPSKSAAIALLILLFPLMIQAEAIPKKVGVSDPDRAEFNWVMHCRGCHGVDANGTDQGAQNMVGEVAKFLHLAEGREYLGRVPGVAFVSISDSEVAELLNWLVQEFDDTHMPEGFIPYSEKEIQLLRKDPLISDVFKTRQNIIRKLKKLEELNAN